MIIGCKVRLAHHRVNVSDVCEVWVSRLLMSDSGIEFVQCSEYDFQVSYLWLIGSLRFYGVSLLQFYNYCEVSKLRLLFAHTGSESPHYLCRNSGKRINGCWKGMSIRNSSNSLKEPSISSSVVIAMLTDTAHLVVIIKPTYTYFVTDFAAPIELFFIDPWVKNSFSAVLF